MAAYGVRLARDGRRAHRLVRFLRALHLARVRSRLGGGVLRAVLAPYERGGFGERLRRHVRGVRPHVGDKPDLPFAPDGQPFVELLGDAHRSARRETQLARRFLLERAGDERRRRTAARLALVDTRNRVIRPLEVGDDAVARFLVGDFEPPLDAFHRAQPRRELARRADSRTLRQRGVDSPEFLRDEGVYLRFAVDDEPERHGLDAPRRQPAPHLAPQDGA